LTRTFHIYRTWRCISQLCETNYKHRRADTATDHFYEITNLQTVFAILKNQEIPSETADKTDNIAADTCLRRTKKQKCNAVLHFL
jgi:hypothetical protein